jgi:hypothetical protein
MLRTHSYHYLFPVYYFCGTEGTGGTTPVEVDLSSQHSLVSRVDLEGTRELSTRRGRAVLALVASP